jgi:hypothetical protein
MSTFLDLVTLRTWRCETLTAVTQRPEFVQFRHKQSKTLSNDLANMLSLFQPRSDISGFTRLVQSTIIEPALQLAHKMHLSVHEFSLRYTSYHSTKSEERHPLRREWSQFDCVSLSPPGKVQRPPIADVIFTYLFDLSPELVFRAVKADSFAEPRVLKRGRVLVAVTPEEHGPYTRPLSRPKESPTLLGFMAEINHAKPSDSRSFMPAEVTGTED